MTYMYPSEIRKIEDPKARWKAYKKHTSQDSLQSRIDAGIELSENEIDSLVVLLGKRCRARTCMRIHYALLGCPNIGGYGIFSRVLLHDGGASYCAGQSYPDEIRTVRHCLIGR